MAAERAAAIGAAGGCGRPLSLTSCFSGAELVLGAIERLQTLADRVAAASVKKRKQGKKKKRKNFKKERKKVKKRTEMRGQREEEDEGESMRVFSFASDVSFFTKKKKGASPRRRRQSVLGSTATL